MTHYDTLEVSPQASPEVVRAAYRSLMQRHHPDRQGGDAATATAQAAAITQAYNVISDPGQRAAYDQRLAAASAQIAPASLHGAADMRASARTRATSHAAGAGRGIGTWTLATVTAAVVVAAAVWLANPKADPRAELLTIRATFARGGVPEARLRELYARKEVLLQQQPHLRPAAMADSAAHLAGRTLDLLDSPLVVRLDRGELTLPRVRVVLGTFDTASLRAFVEKNRDALVQEVTQRLARADFERLGGGGGDDYIKALIAGALAKGLTTQPDEDYPSTFFESPGRHGVIAVQLPEQHALRVN